MTKKNVVAVNNVAVQIGNSFRISVPSKVSIHLMSVDDPLLFNAIRVSNNQEQLAGKTAGTTTVSLHDTNDVSTAFSVVVKP